ncbi:MAG: hypothetical protein V3T51_02600 [Gammaproteobacteria bacterium]
MQIELLIVDLGRNALALAARICRGLAPATTAFRKPLVVTIGRQS